mmetsp:Transcript_37878/g.109279  ORF Transcript_37878/g.109279 Transcript_37878/m.109279 type:complete len:166 (-) Transcript_37878:29-526(-)
MFGACCCADAAGQGQPLGPIVVSAPFTRSASEAEDTDDGGKVDEENPEPAASADNFEKPKGMNRSFSLLPRRAHTTFEKPDGTIVSLTFSSRPLGVSFNKKMPCTVTMVKPGCEAEKQGLEPGWVLREVGTVDVTELTFLETYTHLKKAILELPEAPEEWGGPST